MTIKALLHLILLSLLLISPLTTIAGDPFEDSPTYSPMLDDERSDELFFSKGRLFKLGIKTGARIFTGNLNKLIDAGPLVGGYFDYFFTESFATEVGSGFSIHRHHANNTKGDVGVLDLTIKGKFFLTNERFGRFLNAINPHVMAGAGMWWRYANEAVFGTNIRNVGFGFPFGGGFEIPIWKDKVFAGGEFIYELVFFGDENRRTGAPNNSKLDGDLMSGLATISFKF